MAKHHTITALIVGGLLLAAPGHSFAQSTFNFNGGEYDSHGSYVGPSPQQYAAPPNLAEIYGQENQRAYEAEQRELQNEQTWREKDGYNQPQGTWPSGQPYPPGTAPGVTLPAFPDPNPPINVMR